MTENYNKWISFAQKDLAAAEYLLNAPLHPMPYEIICFCAQQSAEKIVKALMIQQKPNVDPPQIHIIEDLLAGANISETDYPEIYKIGNFLTPFATKVRYPAKIDATDSLAKKATQKAKQFYCFIEQKINEIERIA